MKNTPENMIVYIVYYSCAKVLEMRKKDKIYS